MLKGSGGKWCPLVLLSHQEAMSPLPDGLQERGTVSSRVSQGILISCPFLRAIWPPYAAPSELYASHTMDLQNYSLWALLVAKLHKNQLLFFSQSMLLGKCFFLCNLMYAPPPFFFSPPISISLLHLSPLPGISPLPAPVIHFSSKPHLCTFYLPQCALLSL